MTSMVAPLSPMARLRFDVVGRMLDELRDATSLLEIGCGQGAMAVLLARKFDYVGYEPDGESFALAQRRLDSMGRGVVHNEVLPDDPSRRFDIVAAFEVLEHLEDDRDNLRLWVEWLRPGGHVLLSVPAHQERFGPSDIAVGHFRRYSRAGLGQLLDDAGLTDVRIDAYGFPLGFALEWTRNRLLERRATVGAEGREARTAASGRTLQPASGIAPVISVLAAPFAVMQRPFAATDRGTGWVARARRPR